MDFNFVLMWRRAGMPSILDISPSVSRLWALLVWAKFPTVLCKPSGPT